MTRQRIFSLILLLAVAACQNNSVAYGQLPGNGDVQSGRDLYVRGTSQATACSSCHSIDGTAEAGPSLQGIATRAGSRVAGQSGDEYLFRSIVYPNEFLVPGYSGGLMPVTYSTNLTPQQIRDVIAYLDTLK